MNYKYEAEGALLRLLKFKIRFSETHEAYLLNDKWVNEIDEDYFKRIAEHAKRLLNKQLKYGLNQEEFLNTVLDRLSNRLQSIRKYHSITPDITKEYSEMKDPVIPHKETPFAHTDWYEKYKKEINLETIFGKDRLNYLEYHSIKLNNYDKQIDFEYGLLSYAIKKYDEAVSSLYSYVFSLVENARLIDFKHLDFDEELLSDDNAKNEQLCHFNMDKKSLAHLMRILIEGNLIVFDEKNERRNLLLMKRFVEKYFTFLNSSKERVSIKSFNREYSETASFQEEEIPKRNKFINDIVVLLEQRKIRYKSD